MIYSRQRELIYGTLLSHRVHPTADELYAFAKAEDAAVSLATVYRNLNQLVETGRVARVVIPGGADRFDPVIDGHYHMACTSCGAICDIPKDAIPNIAELARQATGLDVEGSKIHFSGLCPACEAHKTN